MSRLTATLVAVLLLISPLAGLADDTSSLEAILVEMADTPAEHQALAAHFEERAEEARDEAERHERMAKAYNRGRFTARNSMKEHCESLAKRYAELANDYEAMAKIHADAAR